MIIFPNCKINLGLNIIRKRSDGFHYLETVFYPVGINDVLEIMPQHNAGAETTFTVTGLHIDGDAQNNLCVKAFHLLKKDFPDLPPIKIHLHKTIPMGAGLGGGSADGAFTLRLLNDTFHLQLTQQQLVDYALQLGSDCPFFILNEPCFAEGRGEKLQPVALDLTNYRLLIINPGIHVNTGWAFSVITPRPAATPIAQIIQQPIATWKHELVNDFEAPVSAAYPVIAQVKADMYADGAVYASMTGSGSTVFGLFEKGTDVSALVSRYSSMLTKLV